MAFLNRNKNLYLMAITAIMMFMISASASDQLSGGWTLTSDTAITQEAQAAFETAVKKLSGVDYEPEALLATYAATGTYYCFLCRKTVVSLDPVPEYVYMYVYADPDDEAEVLQIDDISLNTDIFDAFVEENSDDIVTFENFPDKVSELGIYTEYEKTYAWFVGALDGYKLNTNLEGEKDFVNLDATATICCEVYRYDKDSKKYKKMEETGTINIIGFTANVRTHDGYVLFIDKGFPKYDKVVELFERMQ